MKHIKEMEIEITNNKVISFKGKLKKFKVWDLITYKYIFQNYW